MERTRRRIGRWRVAGLLCVAAASALAQPGPEPALRKERMGWSSLTMQASKLGVSMESTLSQEIVATAQARADLVSPPGNVAVEPGGGAIVRMEVRTSFLGRDSKTLFWLDADDGRALQWTVVETGKRERFKESRAIEGGVWVLRKNPLDRSEEGQPLEKWTRVRDGIEPVTGLPPGKVLSEAAGLLYVLATSPLDAVGDRIEVYMESDGKAFPVSIRVEALERLDVDYRRTGGADAGRIDRKSTALRLSMRPLVPAGMDRRDFKFMSLEGDIDVWLDREGRYPLRIEGRVKWVGKVRIQLASVTLVGS